MITHKHADGIEEVADADHKHEFEREGAQRRVLAAKKGVVVRVVHVGAPDAIKNIRKIRSYPQVAEDDEERADEREGPQDLSHDGDGPRIVAAQFVF